jgi:allantoinase
VEFQAGKIDLVSTDHVAWSRELKNNPNMLKNASGAPGLEVLVPLFIKEALRRGLDLSAAARLLSHNPARHFRLQKQKGALDIGADADFSIIEPAEVP